jgi:hypothetical protein
VELSLDLLTLSFSCEEDMRRDQQNVGGPNR